MQGGTDTVTTYCPQSQYACREQDRDHMYKLASQATLSVYGNSNLTGLDYSNVCDNSVL